MHGLEGLFPHALLGQAAQAPTLDVRLAEAFGQVSLQAEGAQYPDGYVGKKPAVLRRYAAVRGFAGQEWHDGFPLPVGNLVTTHRFDLRLIKIKIPNGIKVVVISL